LKCSDYLFLAAFFFPPFAFFAIWIPPFARGVDASVAPDDPAHSAAWHVGPGCRRPRFVRADSQSQRL